MKQWKAKIKDGKLIMADLGGWLQRIKDLEGKEVEVTIQTRVKKRTQAQNAALHLYFTQLAEELNYHGLDMQAFLKVDVSWNALMVKELLWRPLQKMHLSKKSTTKLKTEDINKIYDILNRVIIERSKGNIQVAFPSIEVLFQEGYK